ncbi:hypothetical protein FJTKL_05381 [Diaporthe vaccinii]|uniref:Uncharacterized protein n=1 Tax=Diaporthe vaccinii TaxID=105482 RepID=A0ABR4FFM0_9PEZI
MTDEHVRMLDVCPQEIPRVGLRAALLGDEISPYLDMRSVQDRAVRGPLLDQGNQPRHLRVIDHNDISSALLRPAEGAAIREPITFSINVVHILGDTEDSRPRLWHVPGQINAHEPSEADERMTHQGDTTPLRCATEEGNLGLLVAEPIGILNSRSPGWGCARILMVLYDGEVSTERGISLNDTAKANLKKGH